MATLLEHTVMPSGGDYTSLDACIDHLLASHHDLLGDDKYAEIKIDGTWSSADTAAVTIDGLHTDATHYLLAYTTAAARQDPHSVTWDTGAHNLVVSNTDGVKVYDNHVRIDGLQIAVTVIDSNDANPLELYSLTSGANDIRISNCILKGHGNASYSQAGIYIGDGSNAKIWNIIIYGIGTVNTSTRAVLSYESTVSLYNVTSIGGYVGLYHSGGTTVAKNCYFGGAGAGTDYSGTMTLTTCASSDGVTRTGIAAAVRSVLVDIDTFINVSAGTEDFHLAADGLSPLQATGTDTTGDAAPLNFTTDIDGDTRDATWDIGADGIPAGGAIDLVPAEGMQEQAADDPALTQVHNLVVDEGMQVQVSDAPALTQVHVLAAQEGVQEQIGDSPALTQVHVLAPAEGVQDQVSDAPVLTQVHVLAAQEGVQEQVSDSPAFTQIHVLVPAEGVQEQVSDQATITVGGVDLIAAEGMQVQISDTPAVTQTHILVPAEGVQAQISDAPALTQIHILTPAKGFQAQVSDAAILDLSILLATQKGYQAQYSDSPTLTVISAKVGTDSSLWASKKGLHKPLGKKWYRPGVRGQRWYRPSEKLFK